MNENTMTEDRFWDLIGKTTAHEADSERQLIELQKVLRDLTPSELIAFERAFHAEQKRAYTWDLWGAVFVLNRGFASDDEFEYFQRWLISKGRKVFEAVVTDPDFLGSILVPSEPGAYSFEEFAVVAGGVWAEKTGIDPWKDPKGTFPYTGAPPAAQPSGTPFKRDPGALSKRYPKLWALAHREVP